MKVKVGDPIVVEHSRYRPTDEIRTSTGTVTKVARKYFTVEMVSVSKRFSSDETYETRRTDEFEISNGVQRGDPNYTHYRDHAYTPEEYNEELYKREIKGKLREEHGFWGSSGHDGTVSSVDKLTLLEQVELLAFLDRVKARQQTKDLDR